METSKEMIDELVSHVDAGSFVLEPSAGEGILAARLFTDKNCTVDCIELNKRNYRKLDLLRYAGIVHTVWNDNFLGVDWNDDTYDYVVAVPPYKDNVDCEHIMHMLDFVKPGGKIVTFTHPAWVTGFYTNQVAFRKWLKGKKYEMKLFEDDKSYMSCPKMLLIIQK